MTERSDARSPWAIGGTIFAATMMLMIGVFQILMGIAAIARGAFFFRPATGAYVYSWNTGVYGWIHLILGILVLITGFGLYQGAIWARVVGIGIVVLVAIDNFLFIPYYPLWSLMLIALNVFVIWALASGGSSDSDAWGG